MSYAANIAQSSASNSFSSAAVNGAIACALKVVSWGGKSVVTLPSPDLTGAALSGLTTGMTVIFSVFGMRSERVKNQLAKLGFSDHTLKQIENVIVFATPFFVTTLCVPMLASRMGHEITYFACALYATLDLALFAEYVSWKFYA